MAPEARREERGVLQGHPGRYAYVLAVGPHDGQGVIRHAAAPGEPDPPGARHLARDLEYDAEALGGVLGRGEAKGHAGIGDGVGVEAAAEVVAVVEGLDVVLAGGWCCQY